MRKLRCAHRTARKRIVGRGWRARASERTTGEGTQLNETSNPRNISLSNPSGCIPLRFNIHPRTLESVTIAVDGSGALSLTTRAT